MRWLTTFICSSRMGDSLGKIVVRPDFPGQLFQLGVGDGLTLAVGDEYADEGHSPGDKGGENGLHRSHPFHLDLFVRVSMCTHPVLRVGCFASFGYRPMPPRPGSSFSA